MNLLWPSALLLLSLIPLMVAAYVWVLRRRRKHAVRYSSLSLIRQALPAQSRLRRHLPFALFLLALLSLVVALSRPVMVTLVPAGRATVMLALDVSGSMRQWDIHPSRLEAAKTAALSFIDRQRANNQIGIVAFAGYAQLVQQPTTDVNDLQTAVRNLTLGRGTAIGSGILEALDTIAEINGSVPATGGSDGSSAGSSPASPVPEGSYVPDIVVVLTDGVVTTGPHPLDAAQQAADRGVRVFTIGFGTVDGLRNNRDREGNFFGRNRGIDEDMLKEIAAMTGGEYYTATSANELHKVFESLPTYLSVREETSEITVVFAALGALAALLAVLLAQLWHPLP